LHALFDDLDKLKLTQPDKHYRYNQGRSQDFPKGGAEIMEAKAMKRKNCL